MMTGSIYAAVGYSCSLVCLILFKCNKELFTSKEKKSHIYLRFLMGYIIFGIIDGTWGLLNAKLINFGKTGFWIISFLFHLFATVAVIFWFIYIGMFFDKRQRLILKIVEGIPLYVAVLLLVAQFFNNCIFEIDESAVYHSGSHRKYLFYIQLFYLLFAFIKSLYFIFSNKEGGIWAHRNIVIELTAIPLVACLLQMFFPNDPYYSIGIIITSVMLFNGIIVIDNNREVGKFEVVSRETYKALEALCSGFISVHLFDLRVNRQTAVKSTVFVDILANKADNAHAQITSVFDGICVEQYREEMLEFVDTYTLDERIKGKKSISKQFEGKVSGWCISTFIPVEWDTDGNLIKVIHAVQSIDETKRKELEYSQAIKRAYENKNAIYAELVKMQSVGMIATDESDRLILANDVAASMFGFEGCNVEGMTYDEFVKRSVMETPEESTEKYNKITKEGGQFSYEVRIIAANEEDADRYLTADVKRVDLLDGTKVIVTCFTDITKRKLLENKLRNLSDIDGLTGIANRRCGEKSMQEILKEKTPGLFCLMDINDFKHINDTYGHKKGDDSLKEVAGALKKSFRSDDIIMRLGGDEFAVFAKNVKSSGLARTKIERLFENLEKIVIEEMEDCPVTVSLGAVLISENSSIEYVKLYSAADEAMYSCKGKGGNNMSIVEI